MAIKINSQTVIDDSKNIINTQNGNFVGIVTASSFSGINKTNVGLTIVFS